MISAGRYRCLVCTTHTTFSTSEDNVSCTLSWITPADTATTARESKSNIATATISADVVEYISGSALTQWVAERQIVTTPGSVADTRMQNRELLGMIQLPKTYYSSVISFCDDITSRFDKLFQPYNIKLVVTRKHNTFITFSLSNGGKLLM